MRAWHILTFLVGVIVLGTYVQPLREDVRNQERVFQTKESEIETLNEQLNTITQLQKEKSEFASEFVDSIPLAPEQDALLQDLYTLTLRHGFVFDAVSFTRGENPQVGIREIRASFNTEGSKRNLIPFLKSIEENKRFLGLKNLSITTSSEGSTETVRFGVDIYAFYQQDE